MGIRRNGQDYTVMELEMTDATRTAVQGLKTVYRGQTRGPKKLTCNVAIQLYSYINGCSTGTYNINEELATAKAMFSLSSTTNTNDIFKRSRWYNSVVNRITSDIISYLEEYSSTQDDEQRTKYESLMSQGQYRTVKRDIVDKLISSREFEDYARDVSNTIRKFLFEPMTVTI